MTDARPPEGGTSRLAVITGASSGIGEATALRLARRGDHRLLLCGRDTARLAAVASAARGLGAEVATCAGDLSEADAVRELAQQARALAPVGAFVHAAGIGAFAPPDELDGPTWRDIVSINLDSAYLLFRELLPLLAHGDGIATAVLVSSDADSEGFPGAAAYCASKSGLLGLARALRLDVRARGVRVCTVSPGRTDTRFNGKEPGMRPGALSAEDVAETIEFAITCSPNIELHEIRLDSMARA